jgi:heme/copper-type cytochrome/quinol oxidase subunit 2
MTTRNPLLWRGPSTAAVVRVTFGALAIAVVCLLAALPTASLTAAGVRAPSVGTVATYAIASPHVVEVTGIENRWHIRYPGPDGLLRTPDDVLGSDDLHVPAGVVTRLLLRSGDYIYNLRLPHLSLAEVAIPELDFHLEFREDRPGQYPLKGDPMCGRPHEDLPAYLIVESEDAYRAALHELAADRIGAE